MKNLVIQFEQLPKLTDPHKWQIGVENELAFELPEYSFALVWDNDTRLRMCITDEHAETACCLLVNLFGGKILN